MQDEKLLVKQCQQGDRAAMGEVYVKYAPLVKAICFRYCKNESKAEDLMQDVFVKVFTKIDAFKLNGSFEGWLRRIAVNMAIDSFHKSKIHHLEVDINDSGIDLMEDEKDESEVAKIAESFNEEQLRYALDQLSDGYRVVFNLFAIDGLSHREISKTTGISEGTSRSQYLRAKKKLKDIILKQFKEKENESAR